MNNYSVRIDRMFGDNRCHGRNCKSIISVGDRFCEDCDPFYFVCCECDEDTLIEHGVSHGGEWICYACLEAEGD